MSKTHTVKVLPIWYERLDSGSKTCEIRKNDRDYQTGDWLELVYFNPDKPNHEVTYPVLKFVITHVLNGFGLEPGYCALSLRRLR